MLSGAFEKKVRSKTPCISVYSQVSNKRGGYNKRGGGDFGRKPLNEEGKNVPNKRVGWNIFLKSINEEGRHCI